MVLEIILLADSPGSFITHPHHPQTLHMAVLCVEGWCLAHLYIPRASLGAVMRQA